MDRQTIDRHASSTEFFSWALVVCCMLTFGVPSYNAPIGFWGAYCAHCGHSKVVSRGIFITSFSLLYDLSILLIFVPGKSFHFYFKHFLLDNSRHVSELIFTIDPSRDSI